MERWVGKVAVLTGGSTAIGLAVSRALVEGGVEVFTFFFFYQFSPSFITISINKTRSKQNLFVCRDKQKETKQLQHCLRSILLFKLRARYYFKHATLRLIDMTDLRACALLNNVNRVEYINLY